MIQTKLRQIWNGRRCNPRIESNQDMTFPQKIEVIKKRMLNDGQRAHLDSIPKCWGCSGPLFLMALSYDSFQFSLDSRGLFLITRK